MLPVSIVDYGLGNINSVRNMLQKVGVASSASCDPDTLARASTLILPGVGAFGAGMAALKERGLVPVLRQAANEGREIIGICLGMQLLGISSEEADCEGLGLINARFRRFDNVKMKGDMPIPHMGWNYVERKKSRGFLRDLPDPIRFYFVHSYFADEVAEEDVLLTAKYGLEFVAAYQRDNVIGFQFHPEKSHRYGICLFEALFARYRNLSLDAGAT